MHVHEFQAKWRVATLNEEAAAKAHFSDLCSVVGQPTPSSADPTGERYAFEKRVTKLGGWAEPPEETEDETILSWLLALNLERASAPVEKER